MHPTFCEECDHVTSATRDKHPAHWTCIKFPRLEGFSAVAPRQWAISEPYNKCMNVNAGHCPMWAKRREPEEQA